MNDSGSESSGVLVLRWLLPGSFADVESEKENRDGNDDAVSGFVVWLMWMCI